MEKQLGWALKLPRNKRLPCQALSPGVEYLSNNTTLNLVILLYHISMTRVNYLCILNKKRPFGKYGHFYVF